MMIVAQNHMEVDGERLMEPLPSSVPLQLLAVGQELCNEAKRGRDPYEPFQITETFYPKCTSARLRRPNWLSVKKKQNSQMGAVASPSRSHHPSAGRAAAGRSSGGSLQTDRKPLANPKVLPTSTTRDSVGCIT